MKKRTYGTGTLRQLASGKWCFEYKPRWKTKRLSKTVEAATEKAAEKQLADWVEELDIQGAPSLEVSSMTSSSCTCQIWAPRARPDQRRARSKADPQAPEQDFSGVDFAQPLKKAAIKKYANARVEAGAKRATVNRELAALKRAGIWASTNNRAIRAPLHQVRKTAREQRAHGRGLGRSLRRDPASPARHEQMLWAFAYGLGVRKGELLKLRLEWLLPYWSEP